MQKIDRKLLDLIVEARRLRGNPESRWERYDQRAEPQSNIGRDLSGEGAELALPVAGALETHFI